MNGPVDAYLSSGPESQRPALDELRMMIREALPKAVEELSPNGFVVYTISGKWVAGLATRKKGPMLYIMDEEVIKPYSVRLGALRSGKSCIEYRAAKGLAFDELRSIARSMLAELATKYG